MKYRHIISGTFLALVLSTGIASAHVIVTPNQVGIAATQLFNVSVPSEKGAPLYTVKLRLVLPKGLEDVLPTEQGGWITTAIQDSNGNTIEIDWSAGSIPPEQREDFTFEAQAPATPTTLDWKAYQTYSDGSVVSWDQTPVPGHADDDSMTPYSTTQVINDLTPPSTPILEKPAPVWLVSVSILLSLAATGIALRKVKR